MGATGEHAERRLRSAVVFLQAELGTVLDQSDQAVIHTRGGDADHAIGASFVGVSIEVVVDRAVDFLPGENERIEAAADAIVGEPLQIQRPALIAAELQPIEHPGPGLDAFGKKLHPRELPFAELGERGAVVRRGEHDEVAERALVEFAAVEGVDPLAHDRAAGGMRNAGEAFAFRELRQHLGRDGLLHAAADVVDRHLIGKADVLPQIQNG